MTAHWWEIIVRVSILYCFLLVLLRVSGKREIGQLGPLDLLTMLLISETVSPALTAQDDSLWAAMIAAGTLLVLTMVIAMATYLSRAVERIIEGTPESLVEDGVLNRTTLRTQRITESELQAVLRQHGVRSLHDVEEATVETNGEITLIRRRDESAER